MKGDLHSIQAVAWIGKGVGRRGRKVGNESLGESNLLTYSYVSST